MPDERGWDVKLGNSLGGSSAGRSEMGVPEKRGRDVKRGNSLGGAPQEGARQECRTSVDGIGSVEIAWGELRRTERDGSAGKVDGM